MNVRVREVVVPASHPALPGHFPGRPIVPAAWILTLVDAACRDAYDAIAITGLTRVRFRSPLLPGARMRIEFELRTDGSIAFACVGDEGRIADGVLATAEPA